MASSKNINSKGNYALEQASLQKNYQYQIAPFYGAPLHMSIGNAGIGVPKYTINTMASNGVDIESHLFGINSTDLERPQVCVNPQLKPVPVTYFYDRNGVIMPKPLVVEKNQRPMFLS